MKSTFIFDGSCIPDEEEDTWQSMETTINELVGKVNDSNIQTVAGEIMSLQNLITARGLFCRAVMKSQFGISYSSDVYAAFVAIINSKFPDIGLLLVKRLVLQFKEAFDHEDEKKMLRTSGFLAHLINQEVVYQVLALDVLLLLLGKPSNENIRIAIIFCLQCGQSLLCCARRHTVDEIFRELNHVRKYGGLKAHIKVSLSRLLAAMRSGFVRHPRIREELDFEVGDQVTHEVSLLHDISPESSLDDFQPKSGLDECEMCSQVVGRSRDSDEVTSA